MEGGGWSPSAEQDASVTFSPALVSLSSPLSQLPIRRCCSTPSALLLQGGCHLLFLSAPAAPRLLHRLQRCCGQQQHRTRLLPRSCPPGSEETEPTPHPYRPPFSVFFFPPPLCTRDSSAATEANNFIMGAPHWWAREEEEEAQWQRKEEKGLREGGRGQMRCGVLKCVLQN